MSQMTHHTPRAAPTIRRRPRPQATSTPRKDHSEDYEVGYCRPPKSHQFKGGKSGNPRGRPKGARGINAMARALLEQKVEMQIGGKRRKVTRIEALLTKQLELASKGDWRALASLIQIYRLARPDPVEEAPPTLSNEGHATAADEAIIAFFRETILAEQAAGERQV